jgi:hypothetical protein
VVSESIRKSSETAPKASVKALGAPKNLKTLLGPTIFSRPLSGPLITLLMTSTTLSRPLSALENTLDGLYHTLTASASNRHRLYKHSTVHTSLKDLSRPLKVLSPLYQIFKDLYKK